MINLKCSLSVEKALHGLFPLGPPPKTPRVFGVATRRILRRPTVATVCSVQRIAVLGLVLAVACQSLHADEPPGAAASVPVATIDEFATSVAGSLPAELAANEKLWRQVAPSVFWLLHDHARLAPADADTTPSAAAAQLARLLIGLRDRTHDRPILAPDVAVAALLDPDRGLDPRQITTLALAYGTRATVFKQDASQSREAVGDAFLEEVSRLATAGQPATIIVLGHGLPREIQSYAIPVERLAAALLPDGSTTADLSHLTLIFDDCYSADFCLNLAAALKQHAAATARPSVRAPTMIAGTSRCRVGHADVGTKFVPHFWAEVIELLYVRTPRPKTVTLGDFLGRVDNAMYGYGRQPVFTFGKLSGYRLTDPEMVQDPVIFVPLSDEDRADLAKVLGLEDPAVLGLVLDVG